MKRISLTQGKFATIDDEDYKLVSQYKWAVWKMEKFDRNYALANIIEKKTHNY